MKRPVKLPFGGEARVWHLVLAALICVAAISTIILAQQRQGNLRLLDEIKRERRQPQPQQRAAAVVPLRRCKGLTKSGKLCLNREWKALRNGYCWRHQDQAR